MRLVIMCFYLLILTSLSGCAVIAVADAAVVVVATGVKATAKVAGAVVDAVTPDGDDEESAE